MDDNQAVVSRSHKTSQRNIVPIHEGAKTVFRVFQSLQTLFRIDFSI